MKNPPNSPDWGLLHAFLATAETGSFSAAARRLGLTQPTLSRQVAALEEQLGLLLFERHGKRLSITEAGEELCAHTRVMGEAAERVALTASGQRSDLSGHIRITASDIVSAHLMPSVIATVRKVAPLISVEIIASNDISNLMTREADIAVRHVRPEQPELVARLICEAKGYFYASTEMLDRTGRPQSVNDLTKLDWLALGNIDQMVDYMAGMGVPLSPEHFRASSENGTVTWEMTKAGLGVSPMDASVAKTTPQVEALLPSVLEVTFPYWLVSHREIHTSPRIRLVYDILAEAISADQA
ncbi:LysR family transcriptional regulator [Lentibacter algarum]|uniref:LysR family transcriptional regulator n=1 Tax=Lentibacter algarum TaxID=576131 RepID=UPI00209144C0|nr:LysR family transcriptional regulator [Lentibacter algarum]